MCWAVLPPFFFSSLKAPAQQLCDPEAVPSGLDSQLPEYRAVNRIGSAKLVGAEPSQPVVKAALQRMLRYTGGVPWDAAACQQQNAFQTVKLFCVFQNQRIVLGHGMSLQKSKVHAQLPQQHLQRLLFLWLRLQHPLPNPPRIGIF